MYVSELVPELVVSLDALCSAQGQVLIAHGRNRGGEEKLMSEVMCSFVCHRAATLICTALPQVKGIFDVDVVREAELDSMYQCSDVAVYRLTRTKHGQEEAGEVACDGQLDENSSNEKKRRRL